MSLADHLDAVGLPAALRVGVVAGPAFPGVWPPTSGWSDSPDGALMRMWARIDLGDWITHSPTSFGPHRAGELATLAAVGAELRTAGEGARVLWAIDVVPTEQWVCHARPGLSVVELVCCGPDLPDEVVNAIDRRLSAIGWSYSCEEANRPATVNRTPCYETSWHEGNTRSSRPV